MAPLRTPPLPEADNSERPNDGGGHRRRHTAVGRPRASADDLRSAAHAAGPEMRSLLEAGAATIDDLESQRDELEMTLSELQAGFPMPPATRPPTITEAVTAAVTDWLDTLDATELERIAPPAISRAFVEASMAADRITTEAVARAERLTDHVATAVGELLTMTADGADPDVLSAWQARFAGSSRALITQLRLPNTVPVADLVELVSSLANAETGLPRSVRTRLDAADNDAWPDVYEKDVYE